MPKRKRKFYLGLVTYINGKPDIESGYITYRLTMALKDEEGEIEIRGKEAAEIAKRIVQALNS